jgi:quercetin dioxygenase-like cupin family protein
VVIGTLVSVALASHTPFNFTTTPLATGNLVDKVKLNSDRVKFQTKEPTDVRVARVDIAPGGYSGWHHHPGIVIVTVASGAVTFTESDCSSKTYGPGLPDGAVFVEGGDEPGVEHHWGDHLCDVRCAARHPARLPDRRPRVSWLPVMARAAAPRGSVP